MSPMWEGRQAGCWGPGEDQAHTLKGQSFTQAAPRGKRCRLPLKNMGETSKTSVFKCSHFVFSQMRVHFSKKISPQEILCKTKLIFYTLSLPLSAFTEHFLFAQ